jgi:hypothetical protein
MQDREKYLERQRRYNSSEKGRVRSERYEQTAAGIRRKIQSDQERGRNPFIQKDRLGEVERYEASGSELSLNAWLMLNEPLPNVRPLVEQAT